MPYHPGAKANYGCVDRVETPDDNSVVFHLKTVSPPLIMLFGYYNMGIVPKHLWETDPSSKNPYATGDKPLIGTGPFKLKEYKRGSHIELVRNENYYRKGKPYLDRIIYKMIPDSSARALALESGEADHIHSFYLPYEAVPRLVTNPNFKVSFEGAEAMGTSIMLAFNLQRKPLNDVRVRKAIAYAIDVDEILHKAFFDVGKVAVGPILSSWPFAYTRNVTIYKRDVNKANSLLDEAGSLKASDGTRFKLQLLYEVERSEWARTAELMYSTLKDVGIGLDLFPVDTATSDKKVYSDWDFDLTITGPSIGPDPHLYSRILATESIVRVGRANCVGYSNPRVDEIFRLVGGTTDQKKRGDLFREFQKIITEELPYYWLLERRVAVVWRRDFVGLPVGVWGGREHYENVWWTKGELPVPKPTVTTTTPSPPKPLTEAVPTWGYVAAIAVIVLVAGGIALSKRKRKT
jgi:peptide/nickel transport system substrate-binding protein